jgi:Domain of Unknown Function (DUF349)
MHAWPQKPAFPTSIIGIFMSVISRLFGQAPTPPEPDAAPPADPAALPVPELTRLALANGADQPELQRAARQRLAELLDSGAATLATLAVSGDAAALLSVAGMCRNETVVAAALAGITDETQFGELALRGTGPILRRLAAEQVHSPALLARLLKDAQGKDKNVYRILKTKRDALNAAERAAAEALAALQTLCGTIERHGRQPYSDTYASTVQYLNSEWQAVAAGAPAELRAQAETALARCHEVVARHEQQLAEATARVAALAAAQDARRELLQATRSLLAEVCAASAHDASASLAAHRAHWSEHAATRAPARDEQKEFEQLGHAIDALVEFNAQHGSLAMLAAAVSDDNAPLLLAALGQVRLLGPDVPAAAEAAAAALQSWEAARAAERDAAANTQRQAAALLRRAQGALAEGNSRQAAGIRRALEDKLQAMPALPASVASHLHAFDAKLALLQDWRSYAVAPKRTELIEQMEALVGSTASPKVLAEQIHKFQEEWKLISKGNTEDTAAEWERFHNAAQQAYEPCKAHFTAQAQQRADNLAKRAALLERLQAFAVAQTWDQTDWREVARALRESRQLWRSHQPVERAANRPLQERFDALIADLQTRLDAEYERNLEAKRQLIAQAERLATTGDARQAAEDVKRLQLDWKDIGLVPQEQSQRLWDDFRQHCDAVFARRQQQYTEQSAQLNANQAAANAQCEAAEGLAALSGQALVDAVKQLPALREQFAAIGELPRDAARALHHRLERALEKCERQLARQRAEAQLAAWDRALETGDAIRRYRLARGDGQTDETCATLRQAAEALLASDVPWPKGTLPALKAAFAADGTADLAANLDANLDANEAALRTLCVRAELLTGVATPETDHAFRRNYQLQELARGFGQARETGRDALQALLIEWIGCGPTSDGAYAGFLERLARCRQAGAAR